MNDETQPLSSLDIVQLRRVIMGATNAMNSARTDKVGAWVDALHRSGFKLVRMSAAEEAELPVQNIDLVEEL